MWTKIVMIYNETNNIQIKAFACFPPYEALHDLSFNPA